MSTPLGQHLSRTSLDVSDVSQSLRMVLHDFNRFYPTKTLKTAFGLVFHLLLKPKLSMFVAPEPSTYLIISLLKKIWSETVLNPVASFQLKPETAPPPTGQPTSIDFRVCPSSALGLPSCEKRKSAKRQNGRWAKGNLFFLSDGDSLEQIKDVKEPSKSVKLARNPQPNLRLTLSKF